MLSLTKIIGVVALTLGVSHYVTAHMQMYSPIPRGDIRNKEYKVPSHKIDAPLNGRKNPGKYPCRYQEKGPITGQYTAGKNFTVEFMQGSPHMGGHCQFGVSYDNGQTWVVLRTITTMCFEGKAPYQYTVPLPKGARNGRALLGWAYLNAGGNAEFYMNCADIEISGGKVDGSTPQLQKWANRDATKLDGRKYFVDRKIVTIPANAQSSPDGTVVGQSGGGKVGIEQPPAIIPWKNFIASKYISYANGPELIEGLGEFGDFKTFYISTSDNPRGSGITKPKSVYGDENKPSGSGDKPSGNEKKPVYGEKKPSSNEKKPSGNEKNKKAPSYEEAIEEMY
ncbi:hypothetical protein BDF19DRAFT_448948 [Syncephalis fuscata]|nr:hypothetical protein BDF19DRAFT_448948 [Syncephalis fuscata]